MNMRKIVSGGQKLPWASPRLGKRRKSSKRPSGLHVLWACPDLLSRHNIEKFRLPSSHCEHEYHTPRW